MLVDYVQLQKINQTEMCMYDSSIGLFFFFFNAFVFVLYLAGFQPVFS